jgi:anti-sigma B factor antagonist
MDLDIHTREVESPAGPSTVIDLHGELDTYSCPSVREKIVSLVEQGKKRLLLNMGGVEYIDSAGLGTLVGGLKRASENGGQLKIVNANAQIQKVFNITGLVRVFEQFDGEEEALRSFNAPEAGKSTG